MRSLALKPLFTDSGALEGCDLMLTVVGSIGCAILLIPTVFPRDMPEPPGTFSISLGFELLNEAVGLVCCEVLGWAELR